jgi:hypothetical protein
MKITSDKWRAIALGAYYAFKAVITVACFAYGLTSVINYLP